MSRPSQIVFLSQTSRFYDGTVRLLGFPRLWEAVAECAEPTPGASCLDVCTGTGGVALALARRGNSVVGVDAARGLLDRAAEKARSSGLERELSWLRMDAGRLAFADGAYPVVTCAMALHEMAEPERGRVLAEMRRVAEHRLVVAEYRVPGGWRKFRFRIRHAFEYLESDDFGRFLAQDFGERLEEAGVSVESFVDSGAYRIWRCGVGGS